MVQIFHLLKDGKTKNIVQICVWVSVVACQTIKNVKTWANGTKMTAFIFITLYVKGKVSDLRTEKRKIDLCLYKHDIWVEFHLSTLLAISWGNKISNQKVRGLIRF